MAKPVATVKIPIYAEFNGKKIRIGEVEVDVYATPGGRLIAPTPREVVAALRKVR